MLEALTEFMRSNAIISIIIVAFLLSLVVTLVYKYLTNQVLMKELRGQMKKMQAKMKAEPDKAVELQKQAMSINMKLMKESFKPLLITIIPFFAIFAWLKAVYGGLVVLNVPFHVPLSSFETGLGWIGVYIICSLIFSTVLRKLLKVV